MVRWPICLVCFVEVLMNYQWYLLIGFNMLKKQQRKWRKLISWKYFASLEGVSPGFALSDEAQCRVQHHCQPSQPSLLAPNTKGTESGLKATLSVARLVRPRWNFNFVFHWNFSPPPELIFFISISLCVQNLQKLWFMIFAKKANRNEKDVTQKSVWNMELM